MRMSVGRARRTAGAPAVVASATWSNGIAQTPRRIARLDNLRPAVVTCPEYWHGRRAASIGPTRRRLDTGPVQAERTTSHAVVDLVVIGSGPSGQRASIHAAKQGKRVALVERKDVIGGTCINTGTIPTRR